MMPDAARQSRRILLLIIAALIVWGAIHAVGAFLYRHNFDPVRPLIVLGCFAAFLGLWLALLTARARRESRRDRPNE